MPDQAYGQTDVWNDPNWVRAAAQGHGNQARQAQERLREMQEEATRQQNAQQFQQVHEERQAEFGEREKDRQHQARVMEAYRQQEEARRVDAGKERELNVLQTLASLPGPSQQQAQTELTHRLNLTNVTLPPDQAKAALAQFHGQGGQPGQPVATTTPPSPGVTSSGAPRYPGLEGKDLNVNTGQVLPHAATPMAQPGQPAPFGTANAPVQTARDYMAAHGVIEPSGNLGFPLPSGGYAAVKSNVVPIGQGGVAGSPVAPTTPQGYAGGPANAPGSTPWSPGAGGLVAPEKPATAAAAPPASEAAPLQPYGQPTQFHFDALGKAFHALANLYGGYGSGPVQPGGGQPKPPGQPPLNVTQNQ